MLALALSALKASLAVWSLSLAAAATRIASVDIEPLRDEFDRKESRFLCDPALLAALAISTLLPSLLWLLSLALVSLSGSGRPLEVTPVLALSSLLMLCMIGAYVLYWCEMALGSSWLYHVTAGKCHRWLYLLFWKGEEDEPRHERLPESAPDVASTSPTRKLEFSPESHQTSLMGSFDV